MRQRGIAVVLVLVLIAVAAVVVGLVFLSRNNVGQQSGVPQEGMLKQGSEFEFSNPKKSAHWESNTPEHGSALAGVPVNVVINFNFDLAVPSSISIMKDGKEYGVGATTIDTTRLSMRRKMDSSSPDGVYTVTYKACWPDKSCHDGVFQFAIDSSLKSSYEDMRGKREVVVTLTGLSFSPKNILISRGTEVTWVNQDSVAHYVNTDNHPGHNFEPGQNSAALAKGDTFRYKFNVAGIYPYHCSAHESFMTADILVE